MPVPDDLLAPRAAAKLIHCHVCSIYRAVHSGRLPAYRRGNRYLVSKTAVLSLLELVEVQPRPDPVGDDSRHLAALEVLRAQGYRV